MTALETIINEINEKLAKRDASGTPLAATILSAGKP